MKIIRPIDLTQAGVMQNDAPDDIAIPWEPAGRDFSQDFGEVLVSANSAKVYSLDADAGSSENSIKVQVVSAGDTEFLALPALDLVPTSILVSPDDNYLAIAGKPSGSGSFELHVYALATGARVYRRQNTGRDYEFYGTPFGMEWSSDSTKLAFWADTVVSPSDGDTKPRIIVTNTADWSEVLGSGTVTDYVPSATNYSWRVGANGLAFDDAGQFVYGTTWATKRFQSQSNFLFKVSAGDGSTASISVASLYSILVFNQYRSEVLLVAGPSVSVFDAASLAERSNKPDFSGMTRYSTSGIRALDGRDSLWVRDGGDALGYKLFSLTDYAVMPHLDASTALGGLVDETADYYVKKAGAGGFGLIEKATLEELLLTNPQVTEGNIYAYQNHIYEVLSDNNVRPDLGATGDQNATWKDLGFVNPLRMTDGKVGSFTEAPSPLVIEISSGDLIDGIAMFGLSAATVRAELIEGAATVFDSGEQSLRDSSMINGWYSHFFARRGVKQDFVLTSLPPYRGATVRITLTATDGPVRIGELVAGQVRQLGDLLFGSKFGIEDWSRKERNAFGHWEVVERGYSKRGDYQVSVRTNQLSWIQQLLAGLRATPVVYIGSESEQLSIIYGFFVVLDLLVEKPVYSQCRIEVEGLTDDSATN